MLHYLRRPELCLKRWLWMMVQDKMPQCQFLWLDLDCLLSFAYTAMEQTWVRPEILVDGGLEIIDGKHPLQQLTIPTFVPNTTSMGATSSGGEANQGKVVVLTGPNACGKSVYLKQVCQGLNLS